MLFTFWLGRSTKPEEKKRFSPKKSDGFLGLGISNTTAVGVGVIAVGTTAAVIATKAGLFDSWAPDGSDNSNLDCSEPRSDGSEISGSDVSTSPRSSEPDAPEEKQWWDENKMWVIILAVVLLLFALLAAYFCCYEDSQRYSDSGYDDRFDEEMPPGKSGSSRKSRTPQLPSKRTALQFASSYNDFKSRSSSALGPPGSKGCSGSALGPPSSSGRSGKSGRTKTGRILTYWEKSPKSAGIYSKSRPS